MEKIKNVYVRSVQQNSYYNDGVPRVSTDGDPHEILTLVACVSGLVVAVIVIIIIVTVLGCGNIEHHIPRQFNNDIESQANETENKTRAQCKSKRKSMIKSKINIFTIFGGARQSFDVQAATESYL